MHTHQYINSTTFDDSHKHFMKGLSSESPDIPGHVHQMEGFTSLEDGHVHRYSNQTCPAFYDIHGDHYHLYSGITCTSDGHVPGYIPNGHVHGYLASDAKHSRRYTERCCVCKKSKA